MSDLFKRHRPKLSEDEERALWERVRTVPREAGGRRSPAAAGEARKRSPWEVLWARPAVRYGAPALAVALVAFVWIAQQEPVAPQRAQTPQPALPSEERVEVQGQMRDAPEATAPTPGPMPQAPVPPRSDATARPVEPERRSRAADFRVAPAPAPTPADDRLEQREAGRDAGSAREAAPVEERAALGATSGGSTAGLAAPPPPAATSAPAAGARAGARDVTSGGSKFLYKGSSDAAKAAPQAVKDFKREDPRKVNVIRHADEAQQDASVDALILVDPARLAAVMALSPGETAFETMRLPLTGGTAWVVAGRGLEGILRLAHVRGVHPEFVRYAYPERRIAPTGLREAGVGPRGTGARVAILVIGSGTGFGAQFVRPNGDERTMPAPRTTPRARRTALGVELLLNMGNRAALLGVRAEAARLTAERPDDRGARALVTWCDEMVRAIDAASDE